MIHFILAYVLDAQKVSVLCQLCFMFCSSPLSESIQKIVFSVDIMYKIHRNRYIHVNPLNAELNPICHLLALLGAHLILHVSRIRVNMVWCDSFSAFNSVQHFLFIKCEYDLLYIKRWKALYSMTAASCIFKIFDVTIWEVHWTKSRMNVKLSLTTDWKFQSNQILWDLRFSNKWSPLIHAPLKCDAALSGRRLPVFWRNILPLSAGLICWKISLNSLITVKYIFKS